MNERFLRPTLLSNLSMMHSKRAGAKSRAVKHPHVWCTFNLITGCLYVHMCIRSCIFLRATKLPGSLHGREGAFSEISGTGGGAWIVVALQRKLSTRMIRWVSSVHSRCQRHKDPGALCKSCSIRHEDNNINSMDTANLRRVRPNAPNAGLHTSAHSSPSSERPSYFRLLKTN